MCKNRAPRLPLSLPWRRVVGRSGRFMRPSIPLSLRFVLPLAVALAAFAYAVVPLVDSLTLRWFVRDLEIRSKVIAGALNDPLAEMIAQRARTKMTALFNRTLQDERLYGIAVCDPDGAVIAKTTTWPGSLACQLPAPEPDKPRSLVSLPQGSVHMAVAPIESEGHRVGSLALLHDMSFVEKRSQDTRQYVIALFAVMSTIIALITVFVAHLSWRGWMDGVRAMLTGEGLFRPFERTAPEVQPLLSDLRSLLQRIDEERRSGEELEPRWTPDALRRLLRENLLGDEVIVVSNREPYIHVRSPGGIVVQRPASGLVTAVEPVMRACSGTWIAHGAGSADHETVDANDRAAVPPESPSYTLRRVWLTKEEEQGYYFGFANEGLWPLCHVAHVRPVFRAVDWAEYRRVNERFADAVADEAKTADPVVLVQDYHFALLPAMIRRRLPQATVITFWHIPWPNPESFGICPWREEILEGLLGSTILGFHTRYHCKNFIETVDRFLESRIEHEHSLIHFGGDTTLIESYPISIHWPVEEAMSWPTVEACRAAVRNRLGMDAARKLAVGVDRLDYTKGILERFLAVETLLASRPEWIGRFTLVQIAAPSRSSLDEYQNFESRVRALAARINQRFGSATYKPIELLIAHHDSKSVTEHFRACDVCLVTSLHDGMNLVAKEFIAARDDEQGVLVLSQFAGAARELREALIVNPYYIEQTADALHRALSMPSGEQRERMRGLRLQVRDFNVYRWAGRMLLDAARLRRRERIAERIHSQSRASLRRVV